MRCEICGESIGNSESERFGPEFAHKTCVIAFKHGQIDGKETEREACAATAWAIGMDEHYKALGLPVDAREVGSLAARVIRERSNGEVRGASRPAGEASSREAATSTVVLGAERPGKD